MAAGTPPDVVARAAGIRLLVLDVDGVLTDGRLTFDAEGRESKSFHVRDGYGIKRVLAAGIDVAVISGRRSRATEARLAELGIVHAALGRDDKLAALREIVVAVGIDDLEAVACIGDDVPDLALFEACGLAVAVADAHPAARERAHWCTAAPGGRGAVRELCDLLAGARAAAGR